MQQAKLAATEAPLTSATPRYAAATTNYARSSMTLSQRLRDDPHRAGRHQSGPIACRCISTYSLTWVNQIAKVVCEARSISRCCIQFVEIKGNLDKLPKMPVLRRRCPNAVDEVPRLVFGPVGCGFARKWPITKGLQ